MHRFIVALLAAVVALGSAQAAPDPKDNEGTAEHSEVARFPGFAIDNSKRNDYNEVRFGTRGYDEEGEPRGDVKAGRYVFVDYILKDGARQPSTAELIKNYENAFKRAGGSLVSRSQGSRERATYRMPLPNGGERWMQMNVDNEGYRYQLEIIDVAAMAQKLEFSSGEMAQALKTSGRVALHGILFDTGRATIRPESQPLLAEIAAMLKKEPQLRLAVVGHTDNVGEARGNLALSKQRAQSVVQALAALGVDAKRLQPDGKGDASPVADNRSDEGRAQNRRVELVRL